MISRWWIRFLLALAALCFAWWLTGCNVTKGKRSLQATKDSVVTTAAVKDEGSISKETGSGGTKYEKETVITPVIIWDTVTKTDHHYYTTTIKEKGETQFQYVNTDSAWKSDIVTVLAKLTERIEQYEKNKVTKPNATPFIIAGAVILAMFAMLLWFVNKKFAAMQQMIIVKRPA